MKSSVLIRGSDYYIPESDLCSRYKQWIQEQGGRFAMRDWSQDHLSTVYDRLKLTKRHETNFWPMGSQISKTGIFVHGITYNEGGGEDAGGGGAAEDGGGYGDEMWQDGICLLYTSPSPRDS